MPPTYAARRPERIERTAPRSPASSRWVRMPVSTPGAGSRTSVRRWCRARSSRRYWTSSAWQRKQPSTWAATRRSACALPSTMAGRRSATSSHWNPDSDRTCVLLLAAERVEPLAEFPAGPVQPHLGRRLADAELGRDALVGKVIDVPQHDDGPQPRGQLLEGGFDPLPVIGQPGP